MGQKTGCREVSRPINLNLLSAIIIIITTKNNQYLFVKRLHVSSSEVILPVIIKLNQSHKFQ
jgi:hypothetical protein